MSRVMELVTEDPAEVVAKRAYTAFRTIGKVKNYDPSRSVAGKVYIDGWPALLTVEWKPHRDGVRTRLDISATSADELSRAADGAMYKFASVFRNIEPEHCVSPETKNSKAIGWTVAALAIVAAAAYYLGIIPR
ncbi:MAG: hypothetical protein SFU56_09760 [Capsulimonadales bacterium]|nr:hypothetical protein [Capsulimonadales bacterium]